LGFALLLAGLMTARPSMAQDEEEEEATEQDKEADAEETDAGNEGEDAEEAEAEPAEKPAAKPAAAEPATAKAEVDAQADVAQDVGAQPEGPVTADDMSEQKNGYRRNKPLTTFAWSGGMELDVGYATYSFENEALAPEEFYDARGRFVVGPTINYDFNGDWFVAARGELVLWVREVFQTYQINADDVFAQVGQRGLWDLKAGRFRTWRVYHKGLGFDLFTLEDLGACRQNPCDPAAGTATFGPHTYEVSYIYNRETAGHAAAHVYPTPWSGIEVAGAYGKDGVRNSAGGRGAGMLHWDFLRVSAAGEYRIFKPATEARTTDATGAIFTCPRCNYSEYYGYGGGAELTVSPIEVGLNAARGQQNNYTILNGTLDTSSTNMTTSLGGYGELDVGTLAFQRALILGFGANRTEVLYENQNFDQHWQYAGYVAYPLGFNDASLKLVVSHATLTSESGVAGTDTFAQQNSEMTAVRTRLTYPF
jgi:hypothetical protein